MKKGVYIAIVVVLAVALVGSAVYLGSYFWQGKKSEDEYAKLRQDTLVTTTATTEATQPGETTEFIPDPNDLEPEETYPLTRDYKGYYEKNPNDDFVGWLRIEGTKLDYPVMQSPVSEANYYLYRNYNGENSTRCSTMCTRFSRSSRPRPTWARALPTSASRTPPTSRNSTTSSPPARS